MYYVVWEDYDGAYCEECADKESCQNAVLKIRNKSDRRDNGTRLMAIISGNRIGYRIKQEVARIEICPPELAEVTP